MMVMKIMMVMIISIILMEEVDICVSKVVPYSNLLKGICQNRMVSGCSMLPPGSGRIDHTLTHLTFVRSVLLHSFKR